MKIDPMFKKSKTGGLTFIAQGTKLTGDIQFTDEALVSGELQGTIQSRGIVKSGVWLDLDALFDLALFSHHLEILHRISHLPIA